MNKAFIFDMDGTIIDSMSFWKRVPTLYLQSINIKNIACDVDQIVQAMPVSQSAKYLIDTYDLNKTTKEVQSEILQLISEQFCKLVPLKKGIKTFLEKNKNIKMVVATASPKKLAQEILIYHGVYDYFDDILSCDDYKTSKDNPLIFIESAKIMNQKISDCFVFEDNLEAILTAKKAGFKIIGIKDDYFIDDQQEIKNNVDIYIEDFENLNL